MLVRDRMSAPAITMDVRGSIAEARALMRQYEIRRVPVMQNGRLVGIVTQTDLMQALPSSASTLGAWEVPTLLRRTCVKDIMTADPITIGPDMPMEAAALIMRGQKIGGLPVVSDGHLLGMITESDLFEAFIDLTGLREGGARLVIDLGARADAIAKIAATTYVEGFLLSSIATYRQDGRRLAVLRVQTATPDALARELSDQGFPVVEITGTLVTLIQRKAANRPVKAHEQ
jgi:acetoin utilization protein AcuB